MKKTLVQKIDELNGYCKNSLGFTYFSADGWEISSYQDDTLFNAGNRNRECTRDHDFTKLVNKAYKIYLKERKNEDTQG